MKRSQGFRHAVLGILSRADHGLHGWAIKRECEVAFGCVWEVNVGRVYRALEQLKTAELVEPVESTDGSDAGHRRKVFRISAQGRRELAVYLRAAADDQQWASRDDFVPRFLFADSGSSQDLDRLIELERRRCERRLLAVVKRRRTVRSGMPDSEFLGLLTDGAELEVRARMHWLERVAGRLRRSLDDCRKAVSGDPTHRQARYSLAATRTTAVAASGPPLSGKVAAPCQTQTYVHHGFVESENP